MRILELESIINQILKKSKDSTEERTEEETVNLNIEHKNSPF